MANPGTPRRTEIKRNVQKKLDQSDKLGKTLERIAEDNQVVSTLSRELKGCATLEGLVAINKLVEKGHQATVENFKREENNFERRLEECRRIEQDLSARKDSAAEDAWTAEEAARHLQQADATKRYLLEAAAAAENDRYFVDEQCQKAKEGEEQGRRKKDYLTRLIQSKINYSPKPESSGSPSMGDLNFYGMDIMNTPYRDQIDQIHRRDNLRRLWQDRKNQWEISERLRLQGNLDKTRLDISTGEDRPQGYLKKPPDYQCQKDKYKGK